MATDSVTTVLFRMIQSVPISSTTAVTSVSSRQNCGSRSPSRMSMKKNSRDQSGEMGSSATKARPGPWSATSDTGTSRLCAMKPKMEKMTKPAYTLVAQLVMLMMMLSLYQREGKKPARRGLTPPNIHKSTITFHHPLD
ncbi:hypothetical protein EYF80_015232 [Liparis tanakae]|uniref:Uncharacterized protein n=1 Tax=Liparis tanakae TaxID=230148 RepID=A0A4Z2IAM8_9TELE|nr:hypothetical protein EYF80_015232 [Liparis tanakae]